MPGTTLACPQEPSSPFAFALGFVVVGWIKIDRPKGVQNRKLLMAPHVLLERPGYRFFLGFVPAGFTSLFNQPIIQREISRHSVNYHTPFCVNHSVTQKPRAFALGFVSWTRVRLRFGRLCRRCGLGVLLHHLVA